MAASRYIKRIHVLNLVSLAFCDVETLQKILNSKPNKQNQGAVVGNWCIIRRVPVILFLLCFKTDEKQIGSTSQLACL